MPRPAILVLADGTVFRGEGFGAPDTVLGEVVFNTSMTGYQEVLTDPSYAGQLVTLTYPMVGNYGINETDAESLRIRVNGFIVREWCELPSNWRSTGTVEGFLRRYQIPALSGIDTRALTRHLRGQGVMMGAITSELTVAEALELIHGSPDYGRQDLVAAVSTPEVYWWQNGRPVFFPAGEVRDPTRLHIVVLDLGLKFNILRELAGRGCDVTVVPHQTMAREILELQPDGVLLSPGPGDPALLDRQRLTAQGLLGRTPLMGICLGHQVIASALGGKTFKLKFGHRGGNHPVKDHLTGRVQITSQNHGYAVDGDHLGSGARVTHENLNDGTVEGFTHDQYPLICIQYHSEASPGPQDNKYLFDDFLQLVRRAGPSRLLPRAR